VTVRKLTNLNYSNCYNEEMNNKWKLKHIVYWAVTDRTGHVVITQRPNLPLLAGMVVAVLAVMIPGFGRVVFGLAAFGALFTWAWLEIFSGVTPLRRAMGVLFMVLLLVLATVLLTLLKPLS
jgi:uncharacterized membrane protein